jgi:hypothetical protein
MGGRKGERMEGRKQEGREVKRSGEKGEEEEEVGVEWSGVEGSI